MNADGTGLTRLTDGSWNDAEPSWSPDGSTIAFISNRESGEEFQNDIFLMNADGSDQRILVSSPVNLLHPVWSPDGTRIAYAAEGNGYGEIYLINADGTGEFNLTDTGFYAMDVHPAWSPDGERIAFMSSEPGAYTFEIYVINVDGTGLTNLTNNPSSSDHQPDW